MKKIGKLLLFLISLFVVSCNSDPIIDSYYVRFEGESRYNYGGTTTFTMQAGKHKHTATGGCNETLGPISKKDTISFNVTGGGEITRKLYVCRNDEPFVLVAHSNGNEELTYTIDF